MKTCYKFDLKGNLINEYPTIQQAATMQSIEYRRLYNAVHKGYTFEGFYYSTEKDFKVTKKRIKRDCGVCGKEIPFGEAEECGDELYRHHTCGTNVITSQVK